AENGWNYFAHDFEKYMNENGAPFSNIRDMLEASLSDALAARANTFDFRVPEDAIEWMKNEDLVDEFVDKGGYRFVPTALEFPTSITTNDYLTVKSNWKNTGIGKMPNNRPAWDYKYKVAYALLDPETDTPVYTHVTNIDPSEWLKGDDYKYESNVSFGNVPSGTYNFGYAIVDTSNDNQPAINLAITDKKTTTGWYLLGQTRVSGIDGISPKPKLKSYKLTEDWSSTQGKNQWYYLESDGKEYTPMTWESSDDKWHGTYEYTIIAPNAYLHPHDNDTALGWKAPEQGKINITGNIKKDNISCWDGVNIKIMINDTHMWPEKGWQHINADDNKGVNHDIQGEVNQNDMVYFIVNKNENQYCDGTIWNPSIDYVNEDINTSAI